MLGPSCVLLSLAERQICKINGNKNKIKRTIQLIFRQKTKWKINYSPWTGWRTRHFYRAVSQSFSAILPNHEQRVIRNCLLLKRSSCQVLSQSKARVEPVETSRFPALDVCCKYFLGVMLCSIHCLRPLIGQSYFLTLSSFPLTLHLRLKNYSVRHFHTYPFHPRCYDLHIDQIWTWDPCEIKRKKRDWPWVVVTTKPIPCETTTLLFRGVFISLSPVRTYIPDSFDRGYYMAARRHEIFLRVLKKYFTSECN